MVIKLTRLSRELTKQGREKYEAFDRENVDGIPKDEYDKSVEDYTRMGIPPPDDLLDETNKLNIIFDEDEDYIDIESKLLLNTDNSMYIDELSDGNSIVVIGKLDSGINNVIFITVKENIDTIYKLINNR